MGNSCNSNENPKVFISYSHDSEDHREWVKKLAINLRKHGVDAILDQFHLELGGDLRFFIEEGLNKSKMVLCICSSNYVEKSNSGSGGTGYESMIISSSLLKNVKTDYIIPIVRNNKTENKDSNTNQTNNKNLSKKIEEIRNIDKIKYEKYDLSGNVTFDCSNNNGYYTLGTGKYEFDTRWSIANNNVVYAYGDIGYLKNCKEFPKYKEIIKFDFSSGSRRIESGEIVVFKNSSGKFLAVKILESLSKSHGKDRDEVSFKYMIYEEFD